MLYRKTVCAGKAVCVSTRNNIVITDSCAKKGGLWKFCIGEKNMKNSIVPSSVRRLGLFNVVLSMNRGETRCRMLLFQEFSQIFTNDRKNPELCRLSQKKIMELLRFHSNESSQITLEFFISALSHIFCFQEPTNFSRHDKM